MRRGSNLIRLLSLVLLFVPGILGQTSPTVLEPGKAVERELKGGESHRYTISVPAGRFIHVVAVQKGVDVVLRLLAADGSALAEIDSANGANGPEPLWYIVENAGPYLVEVASTDKDAAAGKYEITFDPPREVVPDDRPFVAALESIRKASDLTNASPTPDKPGIISKLSEAITSAAQITSDKVRKAMVLEQVGQAFAQIDEKERALANYDQAIELYLAEGKKAEALSAMKPAQGLASSRLEYIDRNEKIRQLAISINDKRTEAHALREISLGYFELGDFARSLDYTQQSLAIAREINYTGMVAADLDNLGAIYNAQGNFAAALEAHQKALEAQLTLKKKRYEPGTLANIGNVYEGLGNYDVAIQYFERARAEFERTNEKPLWTAFTISNIGSAYLDKGQYDKALEYFLLAKPLKAKYMQEDPTSFSNIAHVYLHQGRIDDAIQYAQQAIDLSEKSGDNDSLTHSLIEMSEIQLKKEDYAKAMEYSGRAAAVSREFDYKKYRWPALVLTARAQSALGKQAEARRSLDEAIETIDMLRTEITGGEENIGRFSEATNAPFQMLAALNVDDRRYASAFDLAERTKARALLSSLLSHATSVIGSMSEAERKTESGLRNQISSLNSQLANTTDKVARQSLETDLKTRRLEFEDFRTRLYASHPELRVQRGEMKPLGVEETAALITDNRTALIEYVIAENKAFLFVITKDAAQKLALKVYTLDVKQKDLADGVEAFRSKIAKGDLDFAHDARGLYDLLLQPAAEQLKGKTNLLIVPDASLWNLPFQALQGTNGKYVIEQAAVSYAPSLTALREMQKKNRGKKTSDASLLAFGNPAVNNATSDRLKTVFMDESLEPLPEAERLVNELGKMYGPKRSKVFTGTDAREATAKSESPKFRIVQFATHGILNNTSPMYSHLVLSQKQDDPNEDGLLEAWELKDLDLKADMVILSACDTARGKIANGEGVIGMTWAAFIAGAPTTVASQWKVESSSTTELMLELHRQLLKGKISKSEALRQAELKLLQTSQYKHPFYWAPFVVIGDGS